MTLLAVQAHVRTLLDGLTTPQLQAIGIGPAAAFVAPPSVVTDTMETPQVYIWGSRGPDKRQTAPRNQVGAVNWTQPGSALPTFPISTAGFREAQWSIDVWLMMLAPSPSGLPSDDFAFPLLIGAVMKQLALDLMAVQLTDPQTGDISQLTSIAEHMEPDYTTPQETADERLMLYTCLIAVKVEEVYNL